MLENGEREVFPFEEKYTIENVAEKLGKSEEQIKNRLLWFTSARNSLRHTIQYILKNMYYSGFDWYLEVPKGMVLKEDFIEEYYRSRDRLNKPVFRYDFSQLPSIIPSRATKVKIFVNEISTKTKKIVGKWETDYTHFITYCDDNIVCSGMASKENMPQFYGTEGFIERSMKKFPGKFGYDRTKYVNSSTKVTLKCLTCGSYFEQLPGIHLNSPLGVCPACAQEHVRLSKIKTQEEFLENMKNLYGDSVDFSKAVYKMARDHGNGEDKIIVINPTTGEEKIVTVSHLLTGNFHFGTKSLGELFVEDCLRSLNIGFNDQVVLRKNEVPEISSVRERVFIDFEVFYNEHIYYIEYNGVQHYQFDLKFHKTMTDYTNQLRRDEAVRVYCKRNNIGFIEIPYIINTKDKIMDFLMKTLVQGIDPETLVDYKALFKTK